MTTRWSLVLAAMLLLGACRSAYYDALETVGYHKRDLLVSRVESARDAQQSAQNQFESALEEFSAVVGFDGGDLERRYEDLDREYKRSESAAGDVTERIDAVEHVAQALFAEWQDELDEYSSDSLRRNSQRQLEEMRARYSKLIDAMRRAESKTVPVLAAFHDQVLALKHNLNAQAIASLQGELNAVETDIAALIREMEASIAEADAFLEAMKPEEGPGASAPSPQSARRPDAAFVTNAQRFVVFSAAKKPTATFNLWQNAPAPPNRLA